MDIHVLQSQPAQKVAFKDSSTVRVGNKLVRNKPPTQPSAMRPKHLVRGGFQPRLPTSLPPPGQQQQPSPLPRRQPVPLMPPVQLHPGAPQVVAPAPAVPLQSPPPSELMDVDPSAGPPSQAVAVQPVLQPLSLGTPKESDTAAPCPAPTQQPSTQRQETLPLFVGPDAPSRPVPEAAPVTGGGRAAVSDAGSPTRQARPGSRPYEPAGAREFCLLNGLLAAGGGLQARPLLAGLLAPVLAPAPWPPSSISRGALCASRCALRWHRLPRNPPPLLLLLADSHTPALAVSPITSHRRII
ncbi:proline-rich protein 36-like [Schistocerca americana]|uniref:proline-rich protein 36-like n=1 Tax=Schistocerca americana TaxID=7009 RepID=UPI001F4FB196|nr:proline-rich protein 36-like [Schistocerca americana]